MSPKEDTGLMKHKGHHLEFSEATSLVGTENRHAAVSFLAGSDDSLEEIQGVAG